MAYDHPEPLRSGEYYMSYPYHYRSFSGNEKRFKEYIKGYLKINEPTSIMVGITKDLKLVCRENPANTKRMVAQRRDEKKSRGRKKK